MKAFYRFLDSDSIHHDNLMSSHYDSTKSEILDKKIILAVQDATTITLNKKEEIEGFYSVGATNGLVVQNTIAVDPSNNSPKFLGIIDQYLHHRKPKSKRLEKDREIFLWFRGIHAIKEQKREIIHVMDRGADASIIINEARKYEHNFIIRAKQSRPIITTNSECIIDFARSLSPLGKIKTYVRKNNKEQLLKFKICSSLVELPVPKYSTNIGKTKCNMVFIEEITKDENPLNWILLTSLEINSLNSAMKVVDYYKCRWIIEEFHKCMKTGFKLEETQLRTLKRIETLIAFVSISSIKLLEFRDLARSKSKNNAIKYLDKEDLEIIKAKFKLKDTNITISQFLIYIARMGGFLARKSDGNPGWITIWRGFKEFIKIKEGYELYRQMKTYG